MAVFDISNLIINQGRKGKEELIDWLTKYVGPLYGSDHDHLVIAVGQGWEIRIHRTLDMFTDDLHIGWEVDITDESKSTLFALKWLN